MIVHLPDNLLLVLSANKKENLTGSLFCLIASQGLQRFPGANFVYALRTLLTGHGHLAVRLIKCSL